MVPPTENPNAIPQGGREAPVIIWEEALRKQLSYGGTYLAYTRQTRGNVIGEAAGVGLFWDYELAFGDWFHVQLHPGFYYARPNITVEKNDGTEQAVPATLFSFALHDLVAVGPRLRFLGRRLRPFAGVGYGLDQNWSTYRLNDQSATSQNTILHFDSGAGLRAQLTQELGISLVHLKSVSASASSDTQVDQLTTQSRDKDLDWQISTAELMWGMSGSDQLALRWEQARINRLDWGASGSDMMQTRFAVGFTSQF